MRYRAARRTGRKKNVKLVTCEVRASASPTRFLGGLLSDQVLVDLNAANPALPGTMIDFLAAGDSALAAARAALDHARSVVDLNAPEKRSEERRVGEECRSRWSPC